MIAQALFATPGDALHAVEKLHTHVFKGSILSATLKKRVEALAKPSGKAKNGTAIPNRGGRLIVRNVPWIVSTLHFSSNAVPHACFYKTTEKDLHTLFLPYGSIYSITMTKAPSSEGVPTRKQRSRGFIFIWFHSKHDAERAIEDYTWFSNSANDEQKGEGMTSEASSSDWIHK